ncbi:MAG: YqgE/AlgH family protein [Muribaculaceae bacterium]|nr:YqgE/AlgH family protein [Muribaculaceae bacterium]
MKDLASRLFKIEPAYRQPAAGHILVSQPFNDNEYIYHGVATVIDYLADEGATGVVLNNKSEYTLDRLLDGVEVGGIPVFCGGPTGQDRLFFIHTLGADIIEGARSYCDGLYVGGNFDSAIDYINRGYAVEGYIRFFIGYANWTEGELEREINAGYWGTIARCQSTDDILTGSGDHYWHRFVRQLGQQYRSWQLLPKNPVCN